MVLAVSVLAASGHLGPSVTAIANAVSRFVPEPQARGPALVFVLLFLLLLPLILLEPLARFMLRRPTVERWLERRSTRPDPARGAELALLGLPAAGVVLRGIRYRVAPIAWTLGSKHGGSLRSPRGAPTLMRDDVVLLDVREGCWLDGEFAPVRGDAIYLEGAPAGDQPGGRGRLRFARARDWRAFTQDLPRILRGLPP